MNSAGLFNSLLDSWAEICSFRISGGLEKSRKITELSFPLKKKSLKFYLEKSKIFSLNCCFLGAVLSKYKIHVTYWIKKKRSESLPFVTNTGKCFTFFLKGRLKWLICDKEWQPTNWSTSHCGSKNELFLNRLSIHLFWCSSRSILHLLY